MAVASRVDSAQHPTSPGAGRELVLLQSLCDAAGITDCDPLSLHLARSWRNATRADAAALAIPTQEEGRYRVSLTGVGDEDATFLVRCPPPVELLDVVLEEVRSRGNLTSRPLQWDDVDQRMIACGMEFQPPGALLLIGATALPQDLDGVFLRATCALIRCAIENDRMLRDAKLAALGEFAAGAGHEINNPLAAISGRAQLLLRGEHDPERRRHLTTIGAQALRIRDLIGDAMLFARPPQPEPESLDLAQVLDRVVDRFAGRLAAKGLTVSRDDSAVREIWADAVQLPVVVSELLRNAIEASPQGGVIRLEVRSERADDGDWVCFSVRDDGPGLTDESAEHLFDPFFSGRDAGRGLGFGLSKCWRIVTGHGGRIAVEKGLERGFGMVVHWPSPPKGAN